MSVMWRKFPLTEVVMPLQQGIIRCRAGVAGRESHAAMESPQALIAPFKINKSSSDDRPGPCICDSKYVEDAKAARSVRVWDRVPIKKHRLGGLR